MLVVGAKGHAKEVLTVLLESNLCQDIVFFDDISPDLGGQLFGQFNIIRSVESAERFLSNDSSYVLGIGGVRIRRTMSQKFSALGGKIHSVVSSCAQIGTFNVYLGDGLNVMKNVFISNDVSIGEGCLLNYGSSVHHDSVIGDFCELSPKCQVLGGSIIGSFTSIGAGAIILPKRRVGDNVIVGAGAVVNKDVPSNSVVAGVPARVIKFLDPLNNIK